jgi:hypothetical protein
MSRSKVAMSTTTMIQTSEDVRVAVAAIALLAKPPVRRPVE